MVSILQTHEGPEVRWHDSGAWVARVPATWAMQMVDLGWQRQHTIRSVISHEYEYGRDFYTTDDAVAFTLREHIQCFEAADRMREFELSVSASAAQEADFEPPAPPGMVYFPFQKAGIAEIVRRKRVLLGDEMGVGKTIQILGAINTLRPRRSLLVVPGSLRGNWEREAKAWLVDGFRVQVINTTEDDIDPNANVVICSYGQLTYRPRITGALEKKEKRGDLTVAEAEQLDAQRKKLREFVTVYRKLLNLNFDFMACDEAHKLKNPTALRTMAIIGGTYKDKPIKGLSAGVEYLIYATGTPVLGHLEDLCTLLGSLDEAKFGDRSEFLSRYGIRTEQWFKVRGRRKRAFKYTGVQNEEELHRKLRGSVMVRRLKADVITELPPKMRSIYVLDGASAMLKAGEEEGALYDEVESIKAELARLKSDPDNLEEYEDKIDALTDNLRLRMNELAKARSGLAERKIPAVRIAVKDFLEQVDKLVVFAHHQVMINALHETFKDVSVRMDGSTPAKKRSDIVARFQNDPDVKLFIGSIQACGVGFTLTAASHMVFGELDWTPGIVVQAEDREHRIGQDETVNIYYLVVDGSVDARIAKRLVSKQRVADAILDGGSYP